MELQLLELDLPTVLFTAPSPLYFLPNLQTTLEVETKLREKFERFAFYIGKLGKS